MTEKSDFRQYALATQRNRQPILDVLLDVLPDQGNILEIASGTGEHAVFFAEHLNPRYWIPSDRNPESLDSIESWRQQSRVSNVHSPLVLDVRESIWAVEKLGIKIAAIVNINMIHIAPWETCLGLLRGAGRLLAVGGIIYLYGPYKQQGKHTAPSNLAFDQYLRNQNPQWGVRNLEDVIASAEEQGLELIKTVSMPANNLSVVFRQRKQDLPTDLP
jgi:hypothetical protein